MCVSYEEVIVETDNNHSTKFNEMEQEIIVLKAVWDMIDEMVNYEIFERPHRTKDTTLIFKSRTHQKFFNIQLVDFLSRPKNKKGIFDLPFAPKESSDTDKSYLYLLKTVCDKPNFSKEVDAISGPLAKFKDWLETECHVENVRFPSIETETDIKVMRVSFVKICGNISKHNFTRLDQDASKIEEILSANNVQIGNTDRYLLLSEFYEYFHDNVFNYHGSAIAEFLNNLRWGIIEYLQPEFHRSFVREGQDSLVYHFTYPDRCTNSFAKAIYWDLMNSVRRQPYMPRFEVWRFLKMRY